MSPAQGDRPRGKAATSGAPSRCAMSGVAPMGVSAGASAKRESLARAASADGVDDLGVVDALEISRCPASSEAVATGPSRWKGRLFVRLARSPDPFRPGLKGLALGSASGSATLNNRITLTASLSEQGSALLRRYRSLLIRIGLSTTGALSATEGSGSYLTHLRAPAR
jgi:hypothetical protein